MTKEHHQTGSNIYDIARYREGMPTTSEASRMDVAMLRFRLTIGNLMNRLHLPGTVRPFTLDDPLANSTIEVAVGPLFTRLTVNGRDYYFDRISGRFSGTGQGCC